MDDPDRIGLSRRELERELQWILRSPPSDPQALVRLFTEAVVTLLDKNNAAIARSLSEREQGD